MGFTTVGYPTRHHKRRKIKHHDEFPVYYDARHRKAHRAKDRSATTSDLYVVHAIDKTDVRTNPTMTVELTRKIRATEKINLQALPGEIIQRIFVLSQDVNSLPLVNKTFYRFLRPYPTLVSDLFWEKYLWDPFEFLSAHALLTDKNPVQRSKVKYLSPTVFDDKFFTNYFIANYEYILPIINGFIHPNVEKNIEKQFLEDPTIDQDQLLSTLFDLNIKEFNGDLPDFIYQRHDLLFGKKTFIRAIFSYFGMFPIDGSSIFNLIHIVQRLFLGALQHYFDNSHIKETELWETLRFLVEFLASGNLTKDCFFLEQIVDLVLKAMPLGKNENVNRRYFIISEIWRRYYNSDDLQNILSDSAFWPYLHESKDERLIDLVIQHGAELPFTSMF
ncbi:uncharacterized protein NDAI_0C05180 [Naumovozyma dairenensis CBS 421]|uniref:F-box domain-containing protein n=1 Tax=Naumovozyma dairenensis (strain ATCC 10597 / BCRC 20456 / CBS 421 / NBRC 0211 / NRRL Y-12639) TaxID=1071378 RepID=G0W8R6_NAUDC|nr:hypothetical protein NDAI_0C05180 [Naumovozyma dairenensis CBS 421]CCD24177.1 hypothetical protein NDAI_0C05180 [Naumovozyma dairenensis CBS 421]